MPRVACRLNLYFARSAYPDDEICLVALCFLIGALDMLPTSAAAFSSLGLKLMGGKTVSALNSVAWTFSNLLRWDPVRIIPVTRLESQSHHMNWREKLEGGGFSCTIQKVTEMVWLARVSAARARKRIDVLVRLHHFHEDRCQ